MAKGKGKKQGQVMRVHARPGSAAERKHYVKSALPGAAWTMPEAIAPGIDPSPLDDLVYHGGKTVAQMEFQNIYLGESSDYASGDIENIDDAITRAMQDKRLNHVLAQYFPGAKIVNEPRESVVLEEAKPKKLDEAAVKAQVIALFDNRLIRRRDLGTTCFNLVLPPGTVLALDSSSSLNGLGGYHGSVHFKRGSRSRTIYFSANVYSEILSTGKENGIAVFNRPWKNVVATLYHELCEFKTDADVDDAIRKGKDAYLGWTSRSGREIGDQPVFVANPLSQVFKEILTTKGRKKKRTPVQFMYSNAVHGAEGPIDKPH